MGRHEDHQQKTSRLAIAFYIFVVLLVVAVAAMGVVDMSNMEGQ